MKHKNLIFNSLFSVVVLFGCQNQGSNQGDRATDLHASGSTQAGTMENHAATPPAQPQQAAPEILSDPIERIPSFTFYRVRSGFPFTNEDIKAGSNTVFVLFDPSCGHCQQEAKGLSDNYDKVKDVNIYFISMNDPALMDSFLKTFAPALEDKDHVEVLYDKNQEFVRKFHIPDQFPANYIYNEEMQLLEHWDGAKGINDIIAAYTRK